MSSNYAVTNPADGQVKAEYETISDAQLNQALDTAVEAQKQWAARPIEERAAVVKKAAQLFDERADELGHIIGKEMGKRHSEGAEEAQFSAEILNYYADNGAEFAADKKLDTPDGAAILQSRPIGVLLGIMPWNFPYYQVARFAAPNLMLGNGIVLKHAEICPESAQIIEDIFREAGLPEGVYVNVRASHDQIAEAIADKRIAGVSLTGSERAGAIVSEQAGKALKKAVLELGGSDPYIILDTEDAKKAAQDAFATRMYNTGQACDSNKRLIVMDDAYDEFVDELVRLASDMKPGDYTSDDPTVYQPLSSRGAAENLAKQMEQLKEAGATIRTGGELADGPGAYFSPAVVTDVPVGSDVYYEELFGPVLVVYRVSSDEEALELANDSRFGLGGTVFSTDTARAEAVGSRLHVGMAKINSYDTDSAALPFGGVKNSGYGRELGPVGMDEFVNKRLFYTKED